MHTCFTTDQSTYPERQEVLEVTKETIEIRISVLVQGPRLFARPWVSSTVKRSKGQLDKTLREIQVYSAK